MKKSLLLLLFCSILLLAGCQKSYYYKVLRYDTLIGEREWEPDVIKASDDSSAFVLACERFNRDKKTYVSIMEDGTPFPKPISFILEDENGNKVYYESVAKKYEKESIDVNPPKENIKVYCGTEFGMSMAEVKSVEHFKDHKWTEFTDMLYTDDEIGGVQYELVFRFVNDKLYRLGIIDYIRSWESYYVMEQKVKVLMNVFLEAYGEPKYGDGIPKENDFYYGQRKTVYEWKMWGKEVEINCGKHPNERLYDFTAIIESPDLKYEKILLDELLKREKEEAERAKAAVDAVKF